MARYVKDRRGKLWRGHIIKVSEVWRGEVRLGSLWCGPVACGPVRFSAVGPGWVVHGRVGWGKVRQRRIDGVSDG